MYHIQERRQTSAREQDLPVSPFSSKKVRIDEKRHFGPTLTLDDVSNTEFLVKFGRTLFVFSHPSCLRFSLRWTDYMCHVSESKPGVKTEFDMT